MRTRFNSARAAVLLLLALFFPFWGTVGQLWADNVTASQARQQAQAFLSSRIAAGNGPRHAPDTTPQLMQEKQVSGLYVFNVSNNGGFIIVSNDDVAVPILGYSDSGSIDPDNMPDNMRAWLQGYADEIAWAKANNIPKASATGAPRRTGSHPTTDIGPLLTTTWNQGSPYNDYCPTGCVTGCVATAMAQVMNYHKWPESSTAIPGYGSRSGLVATNFDWANMKDDYSNGYNETEANAVATLMLYCGWSVEMNYGPSSGTQTSKVATALKSYFGYKSTTQYINRSFYTYANWTDLIYNELKEGRPVVYAGQAADNGHCFVCDGYQYKDGGDQFHINWGWGSQSDGYFVLSVLNPDEQGIGGSASNSAYNSGQEAVVGIQKINGGGTVLVVPSNAPDLTCKSTTPSHPTIALGESIDVTVSVKNNSAAAYDGDIFLAVNGELGVGKVFEIAAGETKDCVITFTPSEVGSYTLGAFFPNPSGAGNYVGWDDLGGSFTVVNQTPTGLTAAAQTYYWTDNISWTNVGGATKWNLRKRTVDITEEDFGSNPGWETQKWSEKGGWVYSANGGIDDTPCYVSPSYSGEDLDPDVGLCTPYFSLDGSISFYAWGEAAEHFALLLQIQGSSQLYYLTDFYETTSTPSLYTFDLSSLSGNTGRIWIDHCNSSGHTSASSLHVDNVNIIAPQGAWTTTEDVTTNPYALTALSSETSYEVQIQPVVNDGGNWSNSVVFTTISDALTLLNDDSAADPNNTALITAWDGHPATLTLSGRTLSGNTWNTCCLPIDLPIGYFKLLLGLQGYDTSGISFKVLDKTNTNLTDGVLTLKFTEESGTIAAGTPFIVKYSSSSSITIPTLPSAVCTIDGGSTAITNMTQTSTDGKVKFVGQWSTFDITPENINEIMYVASGNNIGYSQGTRTLMCFRAHFWVKPSEGGAGARVINIDYGDGTTTSIDLINSDSTEQQSGWYSIDGRRQQGKPVQKGVYIRNGKKVVIK